MADAESGGRTPLLGDHGEAQPRSEQPEWFTPGRLLALFCGISLLVYLDRGALSSNSVNGSPPTADNPMASTGLRLLPAALLSLIFAYQD